MKRLIILILSIFSASEMFAQQMPISENYFLDKYSLSPSYAGNFNNRYLFMGYRSDWTGIDGGPQTLRLSYNDSFLKNAGFGGKFVYDKAGIFKQIIGLATYSYKVKLAEESYLMFALSAGFYSNTLDLFDYYNDPKYSLDPSLVSADVTSRLKFMSDVSAVYAFRGFDAGILFSNINFGDAKYSVAAVKYRPLANFQVHASYDYRISRDWDITPLVVVRGGKYIKSQFEIAAQVEYSKNIWGSLLYRDAGIFGIGLGTNINKIIKIGYNFNIASSTAPRIYNNHEISIGINIFELTRPRREFVRPEPTQYPK